MLGFAVLVACLTIGDVPVSAVLNDDIDLIEYNHFYDAHGKLVFDQLIFYDWSPQDARYQIRDWRLVKHRTQLPVFNQHRDDYCSTWHDGITLRRVTSPQFRESWTQYDPELYERTFLPKEWRRELSVMRNRNNAVHRPATTRPTAQNARPETP